MRSAIETIRQAAQEYTSRRGEDVRSLPWADGLSQLEQSIASPNLHITSPEAKTLIEAIASDWGFMIALVFNKDHTKVVALPLPEVFDEHDRTELGANRYTHPVDLLEISKSVSGLLNLQKFNRVLWVQQDVVLLEKHLGSRRKEYPITVANLNKNIQYLKKDQYMEWIQKTQDELNGVSSSGKNAENAV